MASPTKQQVQKLELEHKIQLYYLLAANRTRINAFKLYMPIFLKDANYKNSAKYKALQNYSKQIIDLYIKWRNRQTLLEKKASVPKFPDIMKQLFNPKFAKEIEKYAIDYINGKSIKGGIGIIPLIVWGVIALIAAFTAVEIIDETTETNEERQELLDATKKFAIDMKLTPEQTTAIVQGQQASEIAQSESGGGIFGGGTIKLVGFGLLAYLGLQMMNKNKSKSNG